MTMRKEEATIEDVVTQDMVPDAPQDTDDNASLLVKITERDAIIAKQANDLKARDGRRRIQDERDQRLQAMEDSLVTHDKKLTAVLTSLSGQDEDLATENTRILSESAQTKEEREFWAEVTEIHDDILETLADVGLDANDPLLKQASDVWESIMKGEGKDFKERGRLAHRTERAIRSVARASGTKTAVQSPPSSPTANGNKARAKMGDTDVTGAGAGLASDTAFIANFAENGNPSAADIVRMKQIEAKVQ
jgi:hypothetical protein